MDQYTFIFSNRRKYRLQRHFAFWLFWWIFLSFIYIFLPGQSSLEFVQKIPNVLTDSFLYLGCHIFLSYGLMYFVIPVYVVKSRYTMAALWTAAVILATAALSAIVAIYLLQPAKHFILPEYLIIEPPAAKTGDNTHFHLALLAGLRGAITVGGIAAAIKLMKHWYTKERLSLQLKKENAESQLQVLKAQVHPHFLFNTLNNIYSFTQNTSAVASEMICGLSDILRYMLYECNKPLVPLSQELKMIEEYINLEKIRYGNKLELHIDVPKEANEYAIAPLLLLPFVENCFKHGTSNIIEQPWINLTLTLNENEMTMKLMNSKSCKVSEHKGIGIANVQQRLSLSYAGRHQLTIKDEQDVYIVILKMKLSTCSLQLFNGKKLQLPLAADY